MDYNDSSETPSQEHTLVCFEYCGMWEVSLDVTVKAPKRWYANIEGPRLSLPFQLESVQTIPAMVTYLESDDDSDFASSEYEANEKPTALRIGRFQDALPVHLLRDDEYPDRFFILIGKIGKSVIRFKLSEEDLEHFVHAFRNVHKTLMQEGLL